MEGMDGTAARSARMTHEVVYGRIEAVEIGLRRKILTKGDDTKAGQGVAELKARIGAACWPNHLYFPLNPTQNEEAEKGVRRSAKHGRDGAEGAEPVEGTRLSVHARRGQESSGWRRRGLRTDGRVARPCPQSRRLRWVRFGRILPLFPAQSHTR